MSKIKALAISAFGAMLSFTPHGADAADYCFKNPVGITMHFRIDTPTERINFVLKPGELHRVGLPSLDGVRVCGSPSPMTTECPREIPRQDIEERKC